MLLKLSDDLVLDPYEICSISKEEYDIGVSDLKRTDVVISLKNGVRLFIQDTSVNEVFKWLQSQQKYLRDGPLI